LGEEFQVALQDLGLHKSISIATKKPISSIFAVVAILITTFLLMEWQDVSTLKQLIGIAAVTLLTFPIIAAQQDNQKKKVADTLVQQVQKELATTGRKLKEIVVRADEAR